MVRIASGKHSRGCRSRVHIEKELHIAAEDAGDEIGLPVAIPIPDVEASVRQHEVRRAIEFLDEHRRRINRNCARCGGVAIHAQLARRILDYQISHAIARQIGDRGRTGVGREQERKGEQYCVGCPHCAIRRTFSR